MHTGGTIAIVSPHTLEIGGLPFEISVRYPIQAFIQCGDNDRFAVCRAVDASGSKCAVWRHNVSASDRGATAEIGATSMDTQPLPSPRNRRPFTVLYLVVLIVAIAVFRLLGRDWVGAITAGLVLAGVIATLLILVGSDRRRR